MKKYFPYIKYYDGNRIIEKFTKDHFQVIGTEPHRTDTTTFAFCTRGSVRATYNFTDVVVSPDRGIMIIPDTFFRINHFTEDVEIYISSFSAQISAEAGVLRDLMHMIHMINLKPVVEFGHEDIQQKIGLLQYIENMRQKNYFFDDITSLIFLLRMMVRQISKYYMISFGKIERKFTREEQIFIDFIILVRENFFYERTINVYADRLGLSVPHLCRTIKKVYRRTPKEIIDEVVAGEAKLCLKHSQASVRTIAENLGFSDVNFFNKWFKKHMGISPAQYRRTDLS